jgi:hypothetical protein
MPCLLLLLLLLISPQTAVTETQQQSTGSSGGAQHRPTAGTPSPHSMDQAQASAAISGPSIHTQHAPQRQLQQQYQHHGQQPQQLHRQQWQNPRAQWQQQRRQLLGPQDPSSPAGPFANLTVGNVTAERENALRKALLDDYDNGAFPWVSWQNAPPPPTAPHLNTPPPRTHIQKAACQCGLATQIISQTRLAFRRLHPGSASTHHCA